MTEHTAVILLAAFSATLTAVLIAVAAGYLARRDHASLPQAITRAATAFAATLTLAIALVAGLYSLRLCRIFGGDGV